MFLALPLVILAASLAVQADMGHGVPHFNRHRAISVPRASSLEVEARSPTPRVNKRNSCKPRTPAKAATSTKKTTATPKPTAAAKSTSSSGTGVIAVEVPRCGPNGATSKVTTTTGPNGSLDWINCGVTTGSGWNPPFMTVKDVKVVSLSTALESSSSPFHACSSFISLFNQYGDEYGVPPIMLASFAMQESSCNPDTTGGGGEQGLMQLTSDKCGGAPGGNCKDPAYNIKTGAKFFSQSLAANGGNLLLTVGSYNGWFKGLTVAKAEAARHSGCCRCQNNLDYVFQWTNGWILNKNAYELNLGKYFNLNVCGAE